MYSLSNLSAWTPIFSYPFTGAHDLPINKRRDVLILVMTGRSDMSFCAPQLLREQLNQGAERTSVQRGDQEARSRKGSCQHESEIEGGE